MKSQEPEILLIYNARLLDEETDAPGAVLSIEGKIRAVFQGNFSSDESVSAPARAILKENGFSENSAVEFFNANGLTVTPSFIDLHVHLRDPGLTQKEDLNSGLHAAAAGGYGTVVAMPNTNPVTSTAARAKEIRERAKALNLANMFQVCSITRNFEGKDVSHLEEINSAEVPVISEDGKEVASSAIMLEGMKIAAKKGMIVACHCEDPELAAAARPLRKKALDIMKEYNLSAWGISKNQKEAPEQAMEEIQDALSKANELLALAEDISTERNLELAENAGCHIHLCHVSTEKSIEAIRRAKKKIAVKNAEFFRQLAESACSHNENEKAEKTEKAANAAPRMYAEPRAAGFSVTCEVTPHHLGLCGTGEPYIRALVNPPLRPETDRLALIEAIRDGTVDCISTDHAPHTAEDKAAGAPGFTGLETSFGVCNTKLVKEGQISAKKLSQLMSANPARILKLNKGLLKTGFDADFTLVNPDEEWKVEPQHFCSKGKATPFEGKVLSGTVKAVFISGKKVFEK